MLDFICHIHEQLCSVFTFCKVHRIKLDLMFMKHYAPNRCLYIKLAKLRPGVGFAEMSHLQKFEAHSYNTFRNIMITNFQSSNLKREIIHKK